MSGEHKFEVNLLAIQTAVDDLRVLGDAMHFIAKYEGGKLTTECHLMKGGKRLASVENIPQVAKGETCTIVVTPDQFYIKVSM